MRIKLSPLKIRETAAAGFEPTLLSVRLFVVLIQSLQPKVFHDMKYSIMTNLQSVAQQGLSLSS